jgi:succinyl-diaminopimelate desuccinylase
MKSAPDVTALARKLISFDTTNPPGGEQACAEYAAGLLETAGFSASLYSFAPGRASVVALLPGSSDAAPLCLSGHLDTVPPGSAPWRLNPWAAEIEDGRLYGRGASDMKSGVAAMLAAAIELAASGRPRRGLLLVLSAGEETGCLGVKYLAGLAGVLPRAGALLVGEPTANYPCLGHKGALWLEAETRGVTAHGSMPEQGVNAVYAAARAVLALEAYRFEAAPHGYLGPPTLNVGSICGGQNINSVPDRAVFTIDARTVPGLENDRLESELAGLLGGEVRLRRLISAGSVASEADDPWVREVFAVMAPVLGETPRPRGPAYFTDASVLRRAMGNPPTVLLGPGESAMAHKTDEYCRIDAIEAARAACLEIARRTCGA